MFIDYKTRFFFSESIQNYIEAQDYASGEIEEGEWLASVCSTGSCFLYINMFYYKILHAADTG